MTRNSRPIRLPSDLYESAVAAAHATSRTVPQQIAHWARIGRELEMSPGVNHQAIDQVLAGTGDCPDPVSYDSLGEQEQAIVREAWAERMTALRDGLNFEAEFTAAGKSYSELDENGNVVVRRAHD